MNFIIEPLSKEKAQDFLILCEKIDQESNFMLLEKGERNTGIMEAERLVSDISQLKVIVFVAQINDKIIGYILGIKNKIERQKHIISFSMGVVNEYQKNNIGSLLIDKMIEYSIQNSIKRIELTVRTDNDKAIRLYKRKGFEIEGTKKSSIFTNNKFYDEFMMSKLIE